MKYFIDNATDYEIFFANFVENFKEVIS